MRRPPWAVSFDVRSAVSRACRGSGSHSGLAFGSGCQRTLARGAADRTWGALSCDTARAALSLQPVPLSPDTGLRTSLQGPPSPSSGRHQDLQRGLRASAARGKSRWNGGKTRPYCAPTDGAQSKSDTTERSGRKCCVPSHRAVVYKEKINTKIENGKENGTFLLPK